MRKTYNILLCVLLVSGCSNKSPQQEHLTIEVYVRPTSRALFAYEGFSGDMDGGYSNVYWVSDRKVADAYVIQYYKRDHCDGDVYQITGTVGYSKEFRVKTIESVENMRLMKKEGVTTIEPCLIDVSALSD
ncbi:hypothetical protein [Hyphomonas sp.]|uniref:hypothetical protein n=1 Tax=Hyphomonas sp. TaxID=87 RepID=UPI000C6917C0|nr:hypothetical protein [Hyphomonas sp.]MAU68559.1 hypothetical protein [Hyphomonas sp.]MBM58515.1 hypothetical protein [Hyphomonas sp.]|tara:strand:- start:47 stop:439 length:393 start_codon:yes stop_codon:yes gene_type:complete